MNNPKIRKLMHATGAAFLGMGAAQSASAIGLADAPLYLGMSPDPNVFFMVDDSGSMDFEILTVNYWYYAAYWDDDSGNQVRVQSGDWRTYSSNGDCTGRDDYVYMFDNDDRLYTSCSDYAAAELSPNSTVRDWRVRSSDFNVLYYDPTVTYEPWPGYSDASFTAARSNPASGQPGYDDTKDLTGFVYEVWTDSHGYDGSSPAGPDTANNSPNGEIDLWDDHTRYTVDASSLARDAFSHDPTSVSAGTECDAADAADDPPYKDCFGTAVASTTPATDGQGRTLSEVKQNIANWYQYHRKRSFVTKAAVAAVVTDKPDFRYGLSLINDYGTLFTQMPGAQETEYAAHNASLLDDFFDYEWGANGTPLRRGLEVAGKYYEGAQSPILPEAKGGACQKNFTILFTDGYWRDSYDRNELDLSSDADSDGVSVTVADVAKHYYDTDLSNLDDEVVPDAFDSAEHQHMVTFTVAFGVTGSLVDSDGDGWPDESGTQLTESDDWYEGIDPSDESECWECPAQIDDLWHAAYNSRGTFVSAATPGQVVSSLQAALASVEARTESSASSVALNTGSISSDSLLYQARFNSDDWSGQLLAYRIISDFGSEDYGQLDESGSGPEGSQWDAGAVLDGQSWDARTILTYNTSSKKGVAFRWPNNPASPGTTSITSDLVTALDEDPTTGTADSDGEARLQYLRGDRSCELGGSGSCSSGSKRFRARGRVLGDIINSAPSLVGSPNFPYPNDWGDAGADEPEDSHPYSVFKSTHADRTPVLYVGANDGMLHGFKADGNGAGTELIAYVPSPVFDNLGALTHEDYGHRFYVDGSPTAGDVYFADAWHSILVGGLNKGGQGVYALDVTNPAGFSENGNAPDSAVLWEFTDVDDSDLGYTFSQPALVRMQNGKWAAVFGNGYNNTETDGHAGDGRAKLFIAFIDGGTDGVWTEGSDYLKLDTASPTHTSPNGLATVSPVDIDGDYIVDVIYGGDLDGNLWKFDVSSSNTNQWGMDYKLFTACADNACAVRQPITTRPEVGSAPNGRDLMVYFGTGKYLGTSDSTNTELQSFYGIIDSGSSVSGRNSLVEQEIESQNTYTFENGSSYDLRYTSNNALESNHRGWFMDLQDPDGAEPGERVVSHPLLRSGRIIFTTMVPDPNSCQGGGTSWLMELDARDGSRLAYSPFDLNNDRLFTMKDYVWIPRDKDGDGTIEEDEGDWMPTSGKRSKQGIVPTPGVLVGVGEELKYTPGTEGGVEVTRENPGPAGLGRQSWRQIR